ncbi:hypothetical protein VCHC57A1_0143, partial [Vibrio cholerae HC-57A1]
MGWVRRACNSV